MTYEPYDPAIYYYHTPSMWNLYTASSFILILSVLLTPDGKSYTQLPLSSSRPSFTTTILPNILLPATYYSSRPPSPLLVAEKSSVRPRSRLLLLPCLRLSRPWSSNSSPDSSASSAGWVTLSTLPFELTCD